MRRMGNWSRHLGWLLLHPGPREEWRWVGWAVVGLPLGVLFMALGLFAFYRGATNALWVLFMGLGYAMLAVLEALHPLRRRRAVLGVRAAITLSFVAGGLSMPLTYPRPLREDSFPVWVAALLIPFLLCMNYFVNRRRARRSRPEVS